MKKVELLAPAKDKLTAIAAINCGCDAVYMGAVNFGARKNAANSIEDIKEVVNYAHKFYVKVHVTLNTILNDDELIEAKELIKKLYDIGVDAIIIQDTGLIEACIRGELPPIVLHASTQCDIRTPEKVKFFEQIGISRVILARELSVAQINEICSDTNIEVETFIHGALCVSYSGQCYLSRYIGGRSANRGECAQPCRRKYSLIDEEGNLIAKDKHLLSLADFNAYDYIETLINAGVKSFKIEGRLKDINYVKTVTAYYGKKFYNIVQKTSSGKVFLDFKPDLYKTFNRGFTDYFLNKRKKCFNFETPKSIGEKLGRVVKTGRGWFELNNQKISVSPQDGLYFKEQGCLVNKVEGAKIYPNNMDGIKCGMTVYRNYDAKFEKQLANSKTVRKIRVDFFYENGILKAIDEDFNTVEITVLSNEKAENPKKMKETFIKQLKKTGESDFYCENININGELAFIPVARINQLRRDISEKLMRERLKNYHREVQKKLGYAKFPNTKLDYRTNIHNSYAKSFYEKCGCKVTEMSFESGSGKPDELMRTKHCLKFAFNMCKSPRKLFLVDGKIRYPLEFDCKNCEMIIKPPDD